MTDRKARLDSILKIGEVVEVAGQKVIVKVDRNKNVSDLMLDGDVVRNVSVNAFVEIRKGFQSLIGKVDGERLEELFNAPSNANGQTVSETDRNQRFLEVSLAGFIDADGQFRGGLRELPLIGNEVFIVTKEKIETVHNMSRSKETVSFASTERDGFKIGFPIDGLFNSHIAVFGNTGSGKSNTLSAMLAAMTSSLKERNAQAFKDNVRVLLFDFNGEFSGPDCITNEKRVFHLQADANPDKIPFALDAFIDIEVLSILLDATEKTQKPFLRRALAFRRRTLVVKQDGTKIENPAAYLQAILRDALERTLMMSEKVAATLLLDYFSEVLCADGEADKKFREELEWHATSHGFKRHGNDGKYFNKDKDEIKKLYIYALANKYAPPDDKLSQVIHFIYLQLIQDVISNRAVNEHVAPVVGRLMSRKDDITSIFDIGSAVDFWESNVNVVNLEHLGMEMRKAVPLLLAKYLYAQHKKHRGKKALMIVIDEAHNILSTQSVREAESWRDYRLETFEEIIKEGRKFGVFLTIASQRPADISPTITSQAHNYFIHRLVNERDLEAVANAVSFIDRVSQQSIPTLPTGTCIFSGVAGQMPLTLMVEQLPEASRPKSGTLEFEKIVSVVAPVW